MSRRRLVLIDGYSLLFRAFYGSRYLSTSDGRPTNALFGFINMLLAILTNEEYQPDAIVVALDAPGKTFRHTDFAEYKGTRRETPPELMSQLEASRELINNLNIPCLEVVGYEADDIIGTLSLRAEENGYDTLIMTGDHDSLQLVDDCVNVLMPQNRDPKPIRYDPAKVEERYGFAPPFIKDYKAMAGDSSDNIPGVPGIGDKSATQLIQQFGTIEEMMERMDEVPEKFRKKIEPALDSMVLSKKLATIDRHSPVEFDFAPYKLSPEGLKKAEEAMLSFEFKSQTQRLHNALLKYLEGEAQDAPISVIESATLDIKVLDPEMGAKQLMDWVGEQPFGFAESAGPDQKSLLEEESDREIWVAVGHEARMTSPEAFLALFEAKTGQAVGHDLKNRYKQIPHTLTPPRMDTLIGAYVMQSERNHYEVDGLVQGYLDLSPNGPGQTAAALLLLEKHFAENISDQKAVLYDLELPLIPVLAEMEKAGIKANRDFFHEYSKTLEVSINQKKTEIYEMAGEEFNIGSPKQIGEILFERMAIPGGRKTKTGYATGAEILSELAATHPIAGEILSYRELTKLKSTYSDALPKMIAEDGRIHTSYSQAVAATGRLSSNDPNLQNIPIRTELGRQLRKAFIAPEGMELLSLDYSQIELRILAHMCGDEALVQAFNDFTDVHTATAALMFNCEQSEVTKEQRRWAKLLNYAVLYGVTGFGLSNQLGAGFSPGDASALIKQYNERFPTVKAFTDGIIEETRKRGFTTTLMGRRRNFPDIHAANRAVRSYAERQAMNAPIQGTAADMIKKAMLDVRAKIGPDAARMLLQVHDELVFEIPAGERGSVEPIRKMMAEAIPLNVPMEVDAKSGPNWLEMSEIPISG